MLRLLSPFFFALFAFIANAQTPLSELPLGDAAQFDQGPHIIVTARLPAGQTDIIWAQELAERNNMTVVAIWPLRSIDILCFVFSVSGDTGAALAAISTLSEVEFAYPIQSFETSSSVKYQDQYVQLQDGSRAMQVWSAHAVTRGKGAVVALIDTAVAFGHDDLANQNITVRNFVSRSDATQLAEMHGTAMAAIILADARNGEGIVGIAPEAKMLALRACWEEEPGGKGRCNTFSIARALNFAILNDADVINLSLTGPTDPILEELIAGALRRGISVVIAFPPKSDETLGSNLPGVVFASSVPRPGSIMAPGTEVLSAKPANDYDFFSGASVSAAHASGAMALLRDLYPNASLGELLAALSKSGANGNRIINLCRALAAWSDPLNQCQ